MMNVGERAGGRAGGWAVDLASVNISFPEHNSATVRNILTKLGRIIGQVNAKCTCKNDNSTYPHCLIMTPDVFYFISGLYLSHHLEYYNDIV